MKAIILAAGRGTRLSKYTSALPKGMLEFDGMPLIQRQIETYKKAGITDVSIVTGYEKNKISFEEVSYFHNEKFAVTNMIESLFCARTKLEGEVIISYADIIFDSELLKEVVHANEEVNIAVDTDWKDYWKARYDKVEFDLESLSFDNKAMITDLGKEVLSADNINGRYVGLIKFSNSGTENLVRIYDESKATYSGKKWQVSGKDFENAYMTDMLQEFIDRKIPIHATKVQRGWLEFDTNEDYERMTNLCRQGKISNFIKLNQ